MIYAVNKSTKEHRVVTEYNHWHPNVELVETDADGWIEWHGGECPLPHSDQYEARIGSRYTYTRGWHPELLNWREVRAYRPILYDTPQAPEWDGEGLPPVGSHVGVIDDCTLRYGADECGPVVAHVEDCAVVRMSYGLGCFKANVLCPIRTDREKWVNQAAELALQTGDALGNIYDALKSGELPQP